MSFLILSYLNRILFIKISFDKTTENHYFQKNYYIYILFTYYDIIFNQIR